MDKACSALTVFFEDPFWVGVFERICEGRLTVCKVTFGAEPRDNEVWEFILRHYDDLTFSPAVDADTRRAADSPKRRQRAARRQVQQSGVGTRSQQALQMQREALKTERRQRSKEQKEAERERRLDLKRQKRKEKHKGH